MKKYILDKMANTLHPGVHVDLETSLHWSRFMREVMSLHD